MDATLFAPGPIGLRERLLALPLEQRLQFDAQHGVLFVDLSRLRLRTPAEVEQLADVLQARLEAIGQAVDGVINYEQFELDPEVADLWAQRAAELAQRHYRRVTRYGGSAFVRARLTQALALRGLPPSMVATADEAVAALRS
jgi:propionate CoA-transferase